MITKFYTLFVEYLSMEWEKSEDANKNEVNCYISCSLSWLFRLPKQELKTAYFNCCAEQIETVLPTPTPAPLTNTHKTNKQPQSNLIKFYCSAFYNFQTVKLIFDC